MNVVVVVTREERSKEGEPQIRAWPRNTIQSLKRKFHNVTTWMNLKDITLSVISQSQKTNTV